MSPRRRPGRQAANPSSKLWRVASSRRWAFGGDAAGFHGDVHVAVKAILFNGNVNGEDVPFLQDAVAGDAVVILRR